MYYICMMYVYMYVFMHACLYVCMYACIIPANKASAQAALLIRFYASSFKLSFEHGCDTLVTFSCEPWGMRRRHTKASAH